MLMLTPVYNLPLNTLNKSFGLGNGVVVIMLQAETILLITPILID